MYKERGRAGYQNERVQQAKGEPLVLVWDDGGEKGSENRQGGNAELESLDDFESGRGIGRETEGDRHLRDDFSDGRDGIDLSGGCGMTLCCYAYIRGPSFTGPTQDPERRSTLVRAMPFMAHSIHTSYTPS